MGTDRRLTRALIASAAVVALATLGVWWWRRPIRWTDAAKPPPPLTRAVEAFAENDLDAGLSNLEAALQRYSAPDWEGRARILGAARLEAAGRDAEISKYLPRALDRSDPLFAHAELSRARGLLRTGRAQRALEAARAALSVPGFPDHDEAVRAAAAALQACGSSREALALLDAGPSPSLRLEGARLAARASDRPGSRRRLATMVLDLPPGEDVERALTELEQLEPDPLLRFEAAERTRLPRRATAWKEAGRVQRALDLLRDSRPAAAPVTSLSPDEALAEADILVRLGRNSEAAPLLDRAERGGPEQKDGAAYLRARIASATGRASAYRAGLKALAGRSSVSRWRRSALLDLARLEEGPPSPRTLDAYRRYREVAGGDAEPIALWREAWAAFELSRFKEADAAIARVLALRDAPDGIRATAMYWLARRMESSAKSAEAARHFREIADRFPSHYYGLLAAERLALSAAEAPASEPPPIALQDAGASRTWLDAARRLRSVGLLDRAFGSYRAALDASRDDVPRRIGLEAAGAAMDAGALSVAVEFVTAAVGDRDRTAASALPERYWQLLFPAPSAAAVTAASRGAGLDPVLVASVILEESAFNPLAVSRVGARGLLQLMPATGEEVARSLGIRGFAADRLFDPDTNLKLGTEYLKSLVDRLGSVPVALAAYNAGATRAVRWSDAATVKDEERFVERIPFPDTRVYVKRILTNTRLYRIAWPNGLGAPDGDAAAASRR